MIYTDIHLRSGGYGADISSMRGGICYRLVHIPTGSDILRTPRDEAHLAENVYLFGNPPLFPPNRILGASFVFDGRTYTLPLNEPETGCHIHGALYKLPFAVEKQTESTVRLVYHAKAGEYIGFPHAFTYVREYLLNGDGLTETDEIVNESELPMPWLLAYHTTFKIPFCEGSKPTQYRVRLNTGREEMRTEKFIPTGVFREPGAREEAFQSGNYVPCGKHLSAFYEASGETVLTDSRTGVSVVYDADVQFAYRMLYQTAEGSFFTCEPQTAAIDCFHLDLPPQEYGLIALSPGERRIFRTRIYVRNESLK
ncbi:MAG: aldose 1-epimerase [Clostridia bacterium]|nr:aldose 1-epimerase [Clostridia bacterium]